MLSGYVEDQVIEEGYCRRDNDQCVGWLRDSSSWEDLEDALDNDKRIGSLLYKRVLGLLRLIRILFGR